MHGVAVASRSGPRAHSWHRDDMGDQAEPSPRVLVLTMRRRTVMSDDGMTVGVRRTQAARDQVRIAYGAVPEILEVLPADDPFRITMALRRGRHEIGRTDQGRAPRRGSSATGVAPRTV